MRYLMFMIPEYEAYKTGALPTVEKVEEMTAFNQELAASGVLLSGDGLHGPSEVVRVAYPRGAGHPEVSDGPYAEAKELIGGYWMLRVDSREEAVAWASKVPADPGDVIELRRVFDMEDFPQDIRDAADWDVLTPAEA